MSIRSAFRSRLRGLINRWLPTYAKHFILRDWKRLPDIPTMGRVLESKRFAQNLRPRLVHAPAYERVIVFAPHPDDACIGCGGVLGKMIDGGAEVTVVYCATGSRDKDPANDRARQLENEANQVATAMGFTPVFLRYPNYAIPLDVQAQNRAHEIIQACAPQAVFQPFLADDHDDHRRAAHLVHLLLGEYTNIESWAYQVYSSLLLNTIVDITDVIDRKCEIIRAWKTANTSRDWAHYARGLAAYNSRHLPTQQPRYAEVFCVMNGGDYRAFCGPYFQTDPKDIYMDEAYWR